MAKTPKPPTSEAALRRAMAELKTKEAWFDFNYVGLSDEPVRDIELVIESEERVLWQGYLSDFYQKRKPLKGVTKKLRKAIR